MFGNGARAVFAALTALAAAATLAFAPCASAEEIDATQAPCSIVVQAADAGTARIVSVYRDKAAQFTWPASSGDADDFWQPTTYRDVVRVLIEVADPSARNEDDNGGVRMLTLTMRAEDLTAAQTAALSNRRISDRIAPFHLTRTQTMTPARHIDVAASRFCDSDTLRCEDHLVYRETAMAATRLSVG